MSKIEERVEKINEMSDSAYSRCDYSDRVWDGIIKKYIEKGWNDEAISEVLMSKWMRWLMDSNNGKKVGIRQAWEFLERHNEQIKEMLKSELNIDALDAAMNADAPEGASTPKP